MVIVTVQVCEEGVRQLRHVLQGVQHCHQCVCLCLNALFLCLQHSGLTSGDGLAGTHAYSTPEVGWRSKAKPASAPDGNIAHRPQNCSRFKQRSAPR